MKTNKRSIVMAVVAVVMLLSSSKIFADNTLEWRRHGLVKIFDGLVNPRMATGNDLFLERDPKNGFVAGIDGAEVGILSRVGRRGDKMVYILAYRVTDRAKFENAVLSRASKFTKERVQTTAAVTGAFTLLPGFLLGGFLSGWAFWGTLLGVAGSLGLAALAGTVAGVVSYYALKREARNLPDQGQSDLEV